MDLRKNLIKKRMKAFLTVEASLVITMTILIIGIVLSLWIYKFQECWYTQAVSECLITGSNKAVLNEASYLNDTKLKWRRVKKENYLAPEDLMVQINGDKDKIKIKVNEKISMWGYAPLQIDVEEEIEIVKPVAYIRKVAAIQEVIRK